MDDSMKIKVLMVGVDKERIGGMWSVAQAYIDSSEYNERVDLRYIATSTNGSKIKRSIKMLVGCMQIFICLCTNKIDIIHIHMAEKGSVYRKGLVLKIAKLFNVKTVVQMHAGPIMDWYKKISDRNKKVVRRLFNDTDRLLVLGVYWKKQLSEIVEESKLRVLYNGTDCSDKNRYNKNGKYVTFLGMVTKKKGAYDLIDAIKLIDDILPDDISVVFCGHDEANRAMAYAKKIGVDKRIFFTGWIDGERKAEILGNTCLCVLPSYFEGLSMAVIESIAFGIPIVTTNISTMPEILGDEIHMVNIGDVEDLSRCIGKLVLDTNERIKQSSYVYERAKSFFSIKENIKKTLEIYSECLEE